MSLFSSHMERGTDYTCTALSQGWPAPSLSVLSPSSLQVKTEARYLICCVHLPLYGLTRMFGILHWSSHRRSLILFRESMKEVGGHTLKISSRRYEDFLNLLQHPQLMLLFEDNLSWSRRSSACPD